MILDWRQAEQFSILLYGRLRDLHLSDILRFVLDNYNAALQWESRLRAYCPDTGLAEYQACSPWLALSPDLDPEPERARRWFLNLHSPRDAVDWNDMPYKILRNLALPQAVLKTLPNCSSCGRRSASLKKCAGCREVMYCNSDWCVSVPLSPSWILC